MSRRQRLSIKVNLNEGDHMIIQDSFIVAKSGKIDDCEDGIVVTEGFAAVIDGATDKGFCKYDGMTPGRFAMLACSEALRSLDPRSDVKSAIAHITGFLAANLSTDVQCDVGPTAVATIYSEYRKEIWQIGDVGFWHEGLSSGAGKFTKVVDRYAAEIRAAVILANLANGESLEKIAHNDPGREAIRGILTHQAVFKNNLGAGKWAYAALDGTPIELDLVTIVPVPAHVSRIVLASDGYPAILPTLQASEELLAESLKKDPLCIGPLLGTKGVLPGNQSYDDRSYLGIAVLKSR